MERDDSIYQRAYELVNTRCSEDATHRIDHTKRLLKLVHYLIKQEGLQKKIDLVSLKMATILHDLGQGHQIKELKKSTNKLISGKHADHSLTIAHRFLRKEGFSKDKILKIEKIIASHGTHGEIGDLEGDILHDADLLDGIGMVGVLRKFTYGGQIGRDIIGSLQFTEGKIKNRKFRTKTAEKIGNARIEKVKLWLKEAENELTGRDLI